MGPFFHFTTTSVNCRDWHGGSLITSQGKFGNAEKLAEGLFQQDFCTILWNWCIQIVLVHFMLHAFLACILATTHYNTGILSIVNPKFPSQQRYFTFQLCSLFYLSPTDKKEKTKANRSTGSPRKQLNIYCCCTNKKNLENRELKEKRKTHSQEVIKRGMKRKRRHKNK